MLWLIIIYDWEITDQRLCQFVDKKDQESASINNKDVEQKTKTKSSIMRFILKIDSMRLRKEFLRVSLTYNNRGANTVHLGDFRACYWMNF